MVGDWPTDGGQMATSEPYTAVKRTSINGRIS